MMTYTAPDGHVIQSLPYPQEVIYTCGCQDIPDGRYFSIETTSSSSIIGIQQIQIWRIVNNNTMEIRIRESSEQELIDYINTNSITE
jgi:hypothetical protein